MRWKKACKEEAANTAVLELGDNTVTLVIGSTAAYFNERQGTLDTAPKIINNRTMLPIRYIAKSFRFKVDWNGNTQEITITKAAALNPAISQPDPSNGSKVLVVYYSASGNTEKVANYIKNAVNADLFVLEPIEEYSSTDLDWTDENSRVNQEHEDETKRDIQLKSVTPANWSNYDTVFIGYPIWWGVAAWPVNLFVKGNDFSSKQVIPFCTSASSGLGESGILLAEMVGTGDWQEGMRFPSGASENDVSDWAKSIFINSES
ncbi:MAG: flavodoxin [Clostridia bacterium]|nr:flavodoxin [Clostridia bacterium]